MHAVVKCWGQMTVYRSELSPSITWFWGLNSGLQALHCVLLSIEPTHQSCCCLLVGIWFCRSGWPQIHYDIELLITLSLPPKCWYYNVCVILVCVCIHVGVCVRMFMWVQIHVCGCKTMYVCLCTCVYTCGGCPWLLFLRIHTHYKKLHNFFLLVIIIIVCTGPHVEISVQLWWVDFLLLLLSQCLSSVSASLCTVG